MQAPTPPYTPNAFIQQMAASLPDPKFGEDRMDYVRRVVSDLQQFTSERNAAEAALLRWHNNETKALITKLEKTTDIELLREACLHLLRQQVVA